MRFTIPGLSAFTNTQSLTPERSCVIQSSAFCAGAATTSETMANHQEQYLGSSEDDETEDEKETEEDYFSAELRGCSCK